MNSVAQKDQAIAKDERVSALVAPGLQLSVGNAVISTTSHRLWTTAGLVLIGGATILIVLSWDGVAAAVATWSNSSTFNHGFLIPPISAWLIWRERVTISAVAPRPNYWGALIILASGGIWLLGRVSGTLVVEQYALLAWIQGLVFTVLGWRAIRIIAFPLFYLYFSVPAGEFLIPWLQNVTAAIAIHALRWTDVPAVLDGVLIHLPTASFEVAKACAGLNFLIATVALGVLFAYLFLNAWKQRLAFLLVALVVPVIANGARVYGIIMIAYLTDSRYAVQIDHVIYGWLFLAFVTLLVIGIGVMLRGWNRWGGAVCNAGGIPFERSSSPRSIFVAGLVGMLAAGITPIYLGYLELRAEAPLEVTIQPPETMARWSAVTPAAFDWLPEIPSADARLDRRYSDGRNVVTFVVAFYTRQRQGAEAVSAANNVVDGVDWRQIETGIARAYVDGAPISVRYSRIVSGGVSKLVWHWYWVGGKFTSSSFEAKLLEAKAKLLRGSPAAAIVMVAADIRGSVGEASRTLDEFLHSLDPLQPLLTQVAEGESRFQTQPSRNGGEEN